MRRRTPFELLDGEWRFALDPDDHGLAGNWHLGHEYTRIAQFPMAIEEHIHLIKEQHEEGTSENQGEIIAWYEREFDVPGEWDDSNDGLTQLTFGACGYETRVWLNGHPLTTIEGEEVHFGEYTSFSYELPPALIQRENRLTVRIADSMDAEIPRGKQQSRVFKQGGIWYHTYTGAVRSVWLETVERNRLRSRLSVSSQIDNRLVEFTFTTRTHDPGLYTLRLTVTPRPTPGAQSIADDSQTITADYQLPLEYGEKVQRVTVEMPDAKLWSTIEPNLYELVAELITPVGKSARIEAHFGLRKIETRGRYVHLNYDQIYLDGILYQPGTATFEQMRRHMRAMKRLGCNLVRVHIAGVDPRIYDLADEMGILLWVEVPSPHSSSQRSRENHWAELMRMLDSHRLASEHRYMEFVQRRLGSARHRLQSRNAPLYHTGLRLHAPQPSRTSRG